MSPVPGRQKAVIFVFFLLAVLSCLPAGTAAPAYGTPGTGTGLTVFLADPATGGQYVSGKVILRFDRAWFRSDAEMLAYAKASHAKTGAVAERDFSVAALPGMQIVRLPPSCSVADAVAAYERDPAVLWAEPVWRILGETESSAAAGSGFSGTETEIIPDDPMFPLQYHLRNTGRSAMGLSGTIGADINATAAWTITRGSGTIVAAILDTGIDDTDPDLATNIWTDPVTGAHGLNVTGGIRDNRTGDSAGHGTEVARILGAVTDNGQGTAGVAWEVRLMALKVFTAGYGDTTTTADVIDAVQYADAHGASVICIPWTTTVNSLAIRDAIHASPALFVAAAGNAGSDNDLVHRYPAAYRLLNLVAVAATDRNDNLAPFSNYGKESVDLAAPGVGIPVYACAEPGAADPKCGYYVMDGTSAAAPQVAGTAVLIKSVDPQLTNVQVRNILRGSIRNLPSLAGKTGTGGRLDAYIAVQEARQAAGAGVSVTGPFIPCRFSARTPGTAIALPCGWSR